MSDIDKKLEQEIAKINAEYEKKIAAVLDISNDPALEVRRSDSCEGCSGKS